MNINMKIENMKNTQNIVTVMIYAGYEDEKRKKHMTETHTTNVLRRKYAKVLY